MRRQNLSLRRHDPIQAQRVTVLQHRQQYFSPLVGDPSVMRSISGIFEWRSTRLVGLSYSTWSDLIDRFVVQNFA
ncbi:hypothetical protein SAMN02745729_105151 [Marinobacterium iners DSM 11526]|uniref:Uncharacterized protein n=1 Tax=Marinobacterium iners DSM 11526 TaxID=1122198 RepID=A0A1H4CU58_9GAMM|nr:hypothetical protein SAMN02745729_105151 [Marinobacterium iners DSM 11526]